MYSCGTVSRFSFRMLARQLFLVKGKMHEQARPLPKISCRAFSHSEKQQQFHQENTTKV